MFLNLRQDRYLSVPLPLMLALAPRIHGWLTQDHPISSVDVSQEQIDSLAEDLLTAGVLCSCQNTPRLPPTQPPTPTRDFRSLPDSSDGTDTYRNPLGVLAALISADYALRIVPLWRIIRAISARTRPPPSDSQFTSPRRIGHLASCFREIRPWYPRNHLCLYDSLALTLFLLRNGARTRWVFGVREDPFAAHCWVQSGTVVVNDYLDRVRIYTPIMWI